MEIIYEKAVFAPKGGKPGYIVNGKWYPVDPKDLESEGLKKELERYGRLRGKEQIEKDISSLKPKPSTPAATTQAPSTPSTTTPTPATPAPAARTPAPATPAPAARTPAPATPTPSRPSSSATASTAEKIRSGMETWRQQKAAGDLESATKTGKSVWALANPKLAAAAAERERIRGTAQTDNPLMKDMRNRLSTSPTVQAPPKKEMRKEAYDLVLEYILSEGHADTISEAHYVMMQMSSDYIKDIVEQLDPDSPGNTHSLADLYKAQEKYFKDNPHLDPKTGKPRKGGSGASSQAKGV